MDRDMVNCLHYLYQWGSISLAQLLEHDPQRRFLWCGADTIYPLQQQGIITDTSGMVSLPPGVLPLLDQVESQLRNLPKPDYTFGYPFSASIRPRGAVRPAFLAIPYDPSFAIVKDAILAAAKIANFSVEVAGDLTTPGPIMDHVWQGIRGADAVIADITGANPNVFYEIGLAHALGKEVVLLSQAAAAPFDIRAARRIQYDPNNLACLERDVASALSAMPARYPHEGVEPRY